jgi:hypothetical protein
MGTIQTCPVMRSYRPVELARIFGNFGFRRISFAERGRAYNVADNVAGAGLDGLVCVGSGSGNPLNRQ